MCRDYKQKQRVAPTFSHNHININMFNRFDGSEVTLCWDALFTDGEFEGYSIDSDSFPTITIKYYYAYHVLELNPETHMYTYLTPISCEHSIRNNPSFKQLVRTYTLLPGSYLNHTTSSLPMKMHPHKQYLLIKVSSTRSDTKVRVVGIHPFGAPHSLFKYKYATQTYSGNCQVPFKHLMVYNQHTLGIVQQQTQMKRIHVTTRYNSDESYYFVIDNEFVSLTQTTPDFIKYIYNPFTFKMCDKLLHGGRDETQQLKYSLWEMHTTNTSHVCFPRNNEQWVKIFEQLVGSTEDLTTQHIYTLYKHFSRLLNLTITSDQPF